MKHLIFGCFFALALSSCQVNETEETVVNISDENPQSGVDEQSGEPIEIGRASCRERV